MIQPQDLNPRELAALLHFYADAGVDTALDEEPVDRFAEFAAQQQARQQRAAPPAPAGEQRAAQPPQARPPAATAIAVPDAEAVAEARRIAASAQTLEALRDAILGFDHCNLKRSAKNSLFASGFPHTGIMVVGAVPGADEDRDGVPFSGKAGELFDRMLGAIGLDREKVVMINALPWRPPGNRTPYQAEMDICRPFLERQMVLCEPKAVLILGNFAARYLLEPQSSLHLLRGEWHPLHLEDRVVPSIASFHPDDLLRVPASKKLAWQDLLRFRVKLSELQLI